MSVAQSIGSDVFPIAAAKFDTTPGPAVSWVNWMSIVPPAPGVSVPAGPVGLMPSSSIPPSTYGAVSPATRRLALSLDTSINGAATSLPPTFWYDRTSVPADPSRTYCGADSETTMLPGAEAEPPPSAPGVRSAAVTVNAPASVPLVAVVPSAVRTSYGPAAALSRSNVAYSVLPSTNVTDPAVIVVEPCTKLTVVAGVNPTPVTVTVVLSRSMPVAGETDTGP